MLIGIARGIAAVTLYSWYRRFLTSEANAPGFSTSVAGSVATAATAPSTCFAVPGLSGTDEIARLTLIAFRLALGSTLPPISYLTDLDIFNIGGTILVFAALLEVVVTAALWDKDRQTLAHRVNSASRLVFPLIFATLLVLTRIIHKK